MVGIYSTGKYYRTVFPVEEKVILILQIFYQILNILLKREATNKITVSLLVSCECSIRPTLLATKYFNVENI